MKTYKIQKRMKEVLEYFWICPICKKEIVHSTIESVFYNIEVHNKHKHSKKIK